MANLKNKTIWRMEREERKEIIFRDKEKENVKEC